jgi:hypothetical protein
MDRRRGDVRLEGRAGIGRSGGDEADRRDDVGVPSGPDYRRCRIQYMYAGVLHMEHIGVDDAYLGGCLAGALLLQIWLLLLMLNESCESCTSVVDADTCRG